MDEIETIGFGVSRAATLKEMNDYRKIMGEIWKQAEGMEHQQLRKLVQRRLKSPSRVSEAMVLMGHSESIEGFLLGEMSWHNAVLTARAKKDGRKAAEVRRRSRVRRGALRLLGMVRAGESFSVEWRGRRLIIEA